MATPLRKTCYKKGPRRRGLLNVEVTRCSILRIFAEIMYCFLLEQSQAMLEIFDLLFVNYGTIWLVKHKDVSNIWLYLFGFGVKQISSDKVTNTLPLSLRLTAYLNLTEGKIVTIFVAKMSAKDDPTICCSHLAAVLTFFIYLFIFFIGQENSPVVLVAILCLLSIGNITSTRK